VVGIAVTGATVPKHQLFHIVAEAPEALRPKSPADKRCTRRSDKQDAVKFPANSKRAGCVSPHSAAGASRGSRPNRNPVEAGEAEEERIALQGAEVPQAGSPAFWQWRSTPK
jgi:hypothetical protein